jgi:hypothetical protein
MSAALQHAVNEIFKDMLDFIIVIYDNFLVCGNSYQDMYDKLLRVLQRADEYNLVLSMSKSWFGFSKCTFFGYDVIPGSYAVSAARKEGIMKWVMPTDLKSMRRLMGAAIFNARFVNNFSIITANLTRMLKPDFNWNKSTWTHDYEADFEKLKQAILDSTSVYLPNYDLQWILRPDSSALAVGSVLYQLSPNPDFGKSDEPEFLHQPLSFSSKKLSEPATNWPAIKLEAHACYFAIHSNEYFLNGKTFILETDHQNLQWIAKSVEHMIVRWRMYMQRFNMWIRHIPGKLNVVADMQSRMYVANLTSQ